MANRKGQFFLERGKKGNSSTAKISPQMRKQCSLPKSLNLGEGGERGKRGWHRTQG